MISMQWQNSLGSLYCMAPEKRLSCDKCRKMQ